MRKHEFFVAYDSKLSHEAVWQKVEKIFPDCTVTFARGVSQRWGREPCVKIEYVGGDSVEGYLDKLKEEFNQQSVCYWGYEGQGGCL